MNNSYFGYRLPTERIAQRPVGRGEARARAKLLHASFPFSQLKLSDNFFFELPDLLREDDLLILNCSAVLPSRFFIVRHQTGRSVEILFTKKVRGVEGNCVEEVWEALAKPMRNLKSGETIALSSLLEAKVLGRTSDECRLRLIMRSLNKELSVEQCMEKDGVMPIPPYIRNGLGDEHDRETYQTVFAKDPGSVACPTAGLHFTPAILETLKTRGVEIRTVTLHVGPASFVPVRDGDISSHIMQEERYSISEDTISAICEAKRSHRRVVAVGTTCVRALESAAANTGGLEHSCGLAEQATSLFITPGYEFKVVDAMVTNFHQPFSTHLLLVGAFIGEDGIARVYKHALDGEYRFLSYGDSMLLEPR